MKKLGERHISCKVQFNINTNIRELLIFGVSVPGELLLRHFMYKCHK